MKCLNHIGLLAALFISSGNIGGQEAQITNIDGRVSVTLNGVWKYVVDPYQTGY